MPRSLLSRRRRDGRSMLRSLLIDAGEALLFFFGSLRGHLRWLRDVDRPPRRSLSLELLIARGTPPNLGGEFLLQAPHKWPISRRRSMTAGISLIPGKTGAHRTPLQLLDPSFSGVC